MKKSPAEGPQESEIDPKIDKLMVLNYETIRKWEKQIIPEFENERLLIELEAQK